MPRTKELRLQNLRRVINKRLEIIKNWSFGSKEVHPWELEPHRTHKFNLNCGCSLCHYYKHCGNSKQKYTVRDLRELDSYEAQKEEVAG